MSLFTDLRDVLTPYAQRIKSLAAADEEIKADLGVYTWNKKGYINLTTDPVVLTPTANMGIDCLVADCVAGDVFTVTASGGASSRAWGFLDSGNHVLTVADANTQVDALEITAPTNAVKLVINNKFVVGEGVIYKNGNNLASRINTLEQAEPGVPSAVKEALLACFERVMWIDAESGQSAYDDLYNALYSEQPVIEPKYDFRTLGYEIGNLGPGNMYTWSGSTRTKLDTRLLGRGPLTTRARMKSFIPAVSGTITAKDGYEISVYLFDSIQFGLSWYYDPKTDIRNNFGNTGGLNFNGTEDPAWVTSFTIEDPDCKYIYMAFRKISGEDWTQEELQNMYGTVFTASLSPTYHYFDIAQYTGGYSYTDGAFVKNEVVVDGGISHKRKYVKKNAVSARAIVDYLPITNGIFRSADPSKYQICVYQIDNIGGFIWDTENPYISENNGSPAWADEFDLSLNPKQSEVFCICISFKKLDGTDFTQEELSNMYGTVFTYEEV